jgi:DNA repair exonuclease SbcCD ATPase subunit
MEQVRDILFGAQLKEMDTRLQRQDERFARSLADAQDALKNRIESLENFMKSEVASLLARIKEEQAERDALQKAEQRERQEALAQLTKDLASCQEVLERKLAKTAATLDSMERELRQLMLKECGALASTIQERYQNSLHVLQNTAEQIRSDMVYRTSLAGMFTETAVKLSGQWNTEDMSPPAPAEDAAPEHVDG